MHLDQATFSSQASLSTTDLLTVVAETSFGAVEARREHWDAAAIALGGSVYFSYDWARTWWEFYGQDKLLRIFICTVGDQIVGVLPIYIDQVGFGPWRFRIARLVGSNIPPKAFIPPVHPDWAERIFDRVLDQLIEKDRCDLVSIGPVSDARSPLHQFEAAAQARRDLAGAVTRRRVSLHTLFHLPKTMDEFFDAMDKDERKKRKYEMRLLAREQAVTRDVVTAPEQLDAEFKEFVRLHALQWADKGKLGHFGSWPRGEAYNLALVRALAASGRVRFVRILSEGQVISSQFAFVFGATWFWELPARLTDRKWNRFSLGTTGFFSLVEEAIKEGKSYIEGGLAHYDYKQKLNGTEYALEVLRVVANRPGSSLRMQLYTGLRNVLEVLYHKIWYARVSPRLPAFLRRPIWSFWLRLDF